MPVTSVRWSVTGLVGATNLSSRRQPAPSTRLIRPATRSFHPLPVITVSTPGIHRQTDVGRQLLINQTANTHPLTSHRWSAGLQPLNVTSSGSKREKIGYGSTKNFHTKNRLQLLLSITQIFQVGSGFVSVKNFGSAKFFSKTGSGSATLL